MGTQTVLIVDDEPDIRQLLDITLSRMGLNTLAAANLEEARTMLAEQDTDLCLTDMKLPDGNGIGLVEHIQAHHPNIPVREASTAHTAPAQRFPRIEIATRFRGAAVGRHSSPLGGLSRRTNGGRSEQKRCVFQEEWLRRGAGSRQGDLRSRSRPRGGRGCESNGERQQLWVRGGGETLLLQERGRLHTRRATGGGRGGAGLRIRVSGRLVAGSVLNELMRHKWYTCDLD